MDPFLIIEDVVLDLRRQFLQRLAVPHPLGDARQCLSHLGAVIRGDLTVVAVVQGLLDLPDLFGHRHLPVHLYNGFFRLGDSRA
ncbi:hypothetical protein G6F59_018937 [Rhizopus arrhizus]|nr:hypothetical protein G6F59_018937 [Rhizopus arrhizus]